MTRSATRYRVTSFDVAAEAGVSQSTVSRALAGSSAITEETRAKVVAAAEKLGYVVDARAAMLRKGTTGTIAVVVICRPDEAVSDINPFYFSLLGAVSAAAAEAGYETLVSFQAEADKLFGRYEERGQADGVIVIGTTTNNAAWEYFRELDKAGANLAFWGSPYNSLEWVRSDNFEGGQIATHALVESGCRRIVHIGTTQSPQRQFGERYEGYLAAMEQAGLEPQLEVIDETADRESQGRKAVASLIEAGIDFDGLFIACDSIALGALDELNRRGIKVPEECGLVGFDGIRAGTYSNPPLTSVEPDFETAGSMLVRRVLGTEEQAGERRVPVHLLRRASVRI
ncbi:LacI family DNA-binding transcriptional regulator [Erythrobacter sp. HKB08]|uniref:LacI family DNA-binding transcriptional regulator n=1 Tax=Erythrobacter sp. HKB08 TaxID=2502843 RepID=UPI001008A352|nr:substrate-binding domain-containing protein [Erythrobacter sp. HKB08]